MPTIAEVLNMGVEHHRAGRLDRAAAGGTAVGERDGGHLIGLGDGAAGPGAVVGAGAAAGPERFGLRRALGEGGGLALGGAAGLLQQRLQLLDALA